jgi:hypothetical protein
MLETITTHITELIAVATTVTAYFFGKKKNNSLLQNDELDQVVKSLKIYRGIVDDLELKIDSLSKQYNALELEFHACKKKLLS